MSPDRQRIAIAEACGWTFCTHPCCQKYHSPDTGSPHELPDYPNDLNAMHEAEKVFDVKIESGDSPRYRYSRETYKVCGMETQPFRATAAQRAEAFLRTLNLWEEE